MIQCFCKQLVKYSYPTLLLEAYQSFSEVIERYSDISALSKFELVALLKEAADL